VSAEWNTLQARVAHHEAAHAVAYARLDAGAVLCLALEGAPEDAERAGKWGWVRTFIEPEADPRNIGISMMAGPAADMHLDGVSPPSDPDEIRYFADSDTPDDFDDAELCALWGAAVDFVAQHWTQIEAVAAALLAAPPDGDLTHMLAAQDFRRVLEQAE
jgi:hypothetical protein